MEFFSNIVNVFTVTFIQFNASLLNKRINLFKENWPQILTHFKVTQAHLNLPTAQ